MRCWVCTDMQAIGMRYHGVFWCNSTVPEKLFGHPVVAHFVGMAERVHGRRARPADGHLAVSMQKSLTTAEAWRHSP